MKSQNSRSRTTKKEERRLVRRLIAGDERAFEEFSNHYIPALYRFALRRLDGDRELTKDIVQSTICLVIRKLPQFRGEAAFSTWLCACCRNEIAAHFRRRRGPLREVELEVDTGWQGGEWRDAVPEGPERSALRREGESMVHRALDEVPPRYGKVLEWKYLEGLPVKEIAARLGVGPKAAESLLTRARRAFRDRYEQLTGGCEPALTPGARATEGLVSQT